MSSPVHMDTLLPEPGERVATFGGSRAGKSSYMEWEMREIAKKRPLCMQVLVDTKPRFRASSRKHPLRRNWRVSAEKLYRSWAAGPVVPNSVVVDLNEERPFRGCWHKDNPNEIVLLQGETREEWVRILYHLDKFCRAQIRNRERRIIVDETLDFYGRNTWGIDSKNDVFYRAARAGGERNIGIELGAHRVHGLPPLVLNQLVRVTLFHLVDDGDMVHLRKSVGIRDAESPKGNYVFRQWVREPGGTVSEPFTGRVTYPESYLQQLAKT